MAVESTTTVTVRFTGDITAAPLVSAVASNTNSPGQSSVVTLASGANTITPPSGGTAPSGVTIVPPSGNTNAITLKGVTGDTGISLHLTNPTHIGLGSTTATFVLTVATTTSGVRLIWS